MLTASLMVQVGAEECLHLLPATSAFFSWPRSVRLNAAVKRLLQISCNPPIIATHIPGQAHDRQPQPGDEHTWSQPVDVRPSGC